MKKNDALKKHHFWILFGLVPLFVLIAVLMISSNVGGEVKKRADEIEATKKDLAGKTNPKSKGVLAEWDKVIATVEDLERIAGDDDADVAAMKGWRRELFGERALALKHGRLALSMHRGRVVTTEPAG